LFVDCAQRLLEDQCSVFVFGDLLFLKLDDFLEDFCDFIREIFLKSNIKKTILNVLQYSIKIAILFDF